MNRRSFLLGSGFTTAGLISSGWGESAKAEAAPIPDLGISALLADETPRSCRPEDPLAALMDGNQRFVAAWRQKNQATTMAASKISMPLNNATLAFARALAETTARLNA